MKAVRISIIIPSYNQGQFIGRTIDSVLNQNYPDIEVFVIDGGSSDNTVEVLKSYGDKLKWVSEKDRGQTHAINKGMEMATGEVLAYLNSDDIYYPQTLESVGTFFNINEECAWLTGGYEIIDALDVPLQSQSIVKEYKRIMLNFYSYFLLKVTNSLIPQPSTFWRREAFEKVGMFDESLRYCMDYDYWLRLGKHYSLDRLPTTLSGFRVHAQSKSTMDYTDQFEEELEVLRKNGGTKTEIALHTLHTKLALTLYRKLK